ncbi:MAG TPA: hypothetical protein VFL86_18900 [Burkholderiaceae bacterium]|nr:hypothetical protein [Burkholderiaceae bacterium]
MTREQQQPALATLPERLMAASTGTTEWRVADPVTGAYCVAYAQGDFADPEREAREWLRRHRQDCPRGDFVHYQVKRAQVQSEVQQLAAEAALEIQRLRSLLDLDFWESEIGRLQTDHLKWAAEVGSQLGLLRALLDEAGRIVADRAMGPPMRTSVEAARTLSQRIHNTLQGVPSVHSEQPSATAVARALELHKQDA